MKKLVCLFSGLIAAAPAFALARPPSPARPVEAAPAARHLSFDRSETVLGRGLGPNGDAIEAKSASRHSSLIEVREDFLPELLKSARDL